MASKVARPEIDDRSEGMSQATLFCRAFGHNPVMKPLDRARSRQMLLAGRKEIVFVCGNGCGRTRTVVVNFRNGEIVEDKQYYADRSYHVPKGTGRMHRSDARLAWLVRLEPEAYARPRARPVTPS